jgi:acetyltransferase-like isoleucine patch superfamily enzyme
MRRRLLKLIYTFIGNLTLKHSDSPITCGGLCIFSPTTKVGKNGNFNGIKIRKSGKVTIGDNFHSGYDCEILTQNHNFEGTLIPYDHTNIVKDTHIGDNVWLGNRVTILPGVTIGEGAIIQAGSVIVSNIPECAIAGGHPAKVFSSRNKEHYFKLKLEKKFH